MKKLQPLAVDLDAAIWAIVGRKLHVLEAGVEAIAVVGELGVHCFFQGRLQLLILDDEADSGKEEAHEVSGGVELFDE